MPSSWTRSLTLSSPLPAGWPGPAPSVSELERRRLEEALEAAQGEARGAQLREEQLQAECERLQGELKQLQETRAQVNGSGAPTPGLDTSTSTAPQKSGDCWKQPFGGPGLPHWVQTSPGNGREGKSRQGEVGV